MCIVQAHIYNCFSCLIQCPYFEYILLNFHTCALSSRWNTSIFVRRFKSQRRGLCTANVEICFGSTSSGIGIWAWRRGFMWRDGCFGSGNFLYISVSVNVFFFFSFCFKIYLHSILRYWLLELQLC